MPPQPWIIRDPSIETPFAEKDVPLINNRLGDGDFAKGPKLRALAISATGRWYMFGSGTSIDDAVRRALEWCGYVVGAACMIVAVGDTFVVPIPRTMKVVGFARSGPINAVAPELRDDVARRLANATSGWSAVAIGASGRVGLKLGASTEQAAIDGSMEACSRQDRDCRVAVLGPFLVDRGL
jgi:adenylate cyclase